VTAIDSPMHARAAAAGAVFAEVAGRLVPRHFGDAAAEYRAVREGVGVADRADLAHVRLHGRDPVKMVQGLITNDLTGAPQDRAVYAAVLTPRGRTLAEVRILRQAAPAGEEVVLDLPREALAGLAEHLRKFVPPMFARWADVSGQLGVVGVYGPDARTLLGRVLGEEMPPLEEDELRDAPFAGARLRIMGTRTMGGEEGFDLLGGSAVLPTLWDALLAQGGDLGVRPVGFDALETLRIEAGRPRFGKELDEDSIPIEAFEPLGLIPRAISFTKGCYTGQEVIVRIAHRGHVNRWLRGLRLGAAAIPAAGTPLHHAETGKPVGRTTSAAQSPLLGEAIALAFVRRELEPGTVVRIGDGTGEEAEIVALPFVQGGR
jgi:folate-binding protein YgfZ